MVLHFESVVCLKVRNLYGQLEICWTNSLKTSLERETGQNYKLHWPLWAHAVLLAFEKFTSSLCILNYTQNQVVTCTSENEY